MIVDKFGEFLDIDCLKELKRIESLALLLGYKIEPIKFGNGMGMGIIIYNKSDSLYILYKSYDSLSYKPTVMFFYDSLDNVAINKPLFYGEVSDLNVLKKIAFYLR